MLTRIVFSNRSLSIFPFQKIKVTEWVWEETRIRLLEEFEKWKMIGDFWLFPKENSISDLRQQIILISFCDFVEVKFINIAKKGE